LLPTFVIGLREGLEASLIVGIIAAFLAQRGDRRAMRWMWAGVACAIALCVAVAVILQVVDDNLPHAQQEGLATILALLAVAGITYMIVWMKRHARELKGSLEAGAETALEAGAWAMVGMAFFAVIREGLETGVFLLATFGSSTNPAATGLGAVLGVSVAVGLGWAIYRGGIRLNLSRFFRLTGFVLVLVAAGLLAGAAHTAHEAGWLNALQHPAMNLSWLVAPGSVRASLLTGTLGLQPVPTWAEVLAWVAYAVPMGIYVLWPQRAPAPKLPDPQPAAVARVG
jgi:high-affinity iron transporter